MARGLNGIRPELEHHPRDPFKVTAAATLDALAATWAGAYGFGYDGDRWQAWRHDGTGELLCGATPDDLAAAILADLGTP